MFVTFSHERKGTQEECLSLFLLKEKVTKKFKDNPKAPPVYSQYIYDIIWAHETCKQGCPANATGALNGLG